MKLPLIYENSKLPIWLSKVVPIEVAAFSFFIFVFCRGEVNTRLKTHETIHYKQQVEMLFIFQWLLYGLFHVIGLLKGRDGGSAYRYNPFELEAYDNDDNENYLNERKPYAWIKYWKEM